MLRQFQQEFTIATRGRGFYEFTEDVNRALAEAKIKTGQVTAHVQHTSASLVIQENADPEVRRDFERFFARLVPDGDRIFEHTSAPRSPR
jgi:secondary thiamine-phosphate synthase enzyme